jgi:glycerophosphoryl diester phosphodiesterase
VLDLVGGRCTVNVEIKSESPDGGDAAPLVAETIRARNLYEQVIVSSFNPIALIQLRWLDPQIALGLLFDQPLPPFLRRAWFSPILQPQAIHPAAALVDADLVAWARQQDCAINVWTVNDADEARGLSALGVDALITDVPDLLLRALEPEAASP